MRVPKLRGFKNPFRTTYQVVNIERLEALYPKGGTVTVEDHLVCRAERVLEPAELGHPHVQRDAAALATLRHLVAGLRALGATPSGLALGALATADACLGGVRTRSRTEVVQPQRATCTLGRSLLLGG